MNIVKTYIDKSTIQGIGLFAEEFIPKGTIIWKFHEGFDLRYDFNWFNNKKWDFPESIRKDFEKYAFGIGDTIIYCCDNAKFANHSNNSNTISNLFVQIAKQDIQIGEEITCNYKEIDDKFTNF